MKKAVAILCGGGPAPGMNTVVGSLAKSFLADDWKVIGLNYGYKTLFAEEQDTVEFDFSLADRIFNVGGSYLKMSRYKPKDPEFKADFFEKNKVRLLVTIGGDDTASTANRIAKFLRDHNLDVHNIHVPKTIDNDLPLPENLPTFGFHTASNEAVRICTTVYEDARTSDNWFIVSSMGREAGHLAFSIGASCHYPMIIIPEMFKNEKPTFDKITKLVISAIIKRKMMGLDYGAAIISEGVFHFMDEEEIKNSGINFTYDDHGHPELGKLSKSHIFNELIQKELEKLNMNVRSRPVEIGYEVRCCSPISFDLEYCTKLGNGVKELYDRGNTGCIVVAKANGKIEPLYLEDVEDENGRIQARLVDIKTESYHIIMNNLSFVSEKDYEEAKKYLVNPEEYNPANILGYKF